MIWKNSSTHTIVWQFFGRYLLDITAAFKTLTEGNIKSFKAIYRAHRDFWKGFHNTYQKRYCLQKRRKIEDNPPTMLSKPVVWDYFVKGKTKFTEIFT